MGRAAVTRVIERTRGGARRMGVRKQRTKRKRGAKQMRRRRGRAPRERPGDRAPLTRDFVAPESPPVPFAFQDDAALADVGAASREDGVVTSFRAAWAGNFVRVNGHLRYCKELADLRVDCGELFEADDADDILDQEVERALDEVAVDYRAALAAEMVAAAARAADRDLEGPADT